MNTGASAGSNLAPETNTAAAADSPQSTEEAQPRRIHGLVACRIVNFVMADGEVRPLLVVNAFDGTGPVNGILFFDGIHDRNRQVVHLGVDASGHVPEFAKLLSNVQYSEDAIPGTYHFAKRESVMASSVDPNALTTQLMALNQAEFEKGGKILTQSIVDLVNEKMAASLEAVKQLLDSHRELIEDLAAGVPSTAVEAPVPTVGEGGEGLQVVEGEGTAKVEGEAGKTSETAQTGS